MTRYYSRPDEYFVEGSECFLVEHCYDDISLFAGVYKIQTEQGRLYFSKRDSVEYKIGDVVDDTEICSVDEFELIED